MKISIIFIIFITIINLISQPALATEATPTASIQAKLDILKQEIASKAAKLKQEIHRQLENKVFMGIVQTKSTNSLTLLTKNETKNIVVNEDTIYQELNKPKSKFQVKSLAEDDRVAALGEIDDIGTLHAKKIVLLPKSEIGSLKTILWGQIISEEDNLLVIQTKDKRKVPVATSKINTQYQPGDFVIVTGYMGKNDILEANFLHIIP